MMPPALLLLVVAGAGAVSALSCPSCSVLAMSFALGVSEPTAFTNGSPCRGGIDKYYSMDAAGPACITMITWGGLTTSQQSENPRTEFKELNDWDATSGSHILMATNDVSFSQNAGSVTTAVAQVYHTATNRPIFQLRVIGSTLNMWLDSRAGTGRSEKIGDVSLGTPFDYRIVVDQTGIQMPSHPGSPTFTWDEITASGFYDKKGIHFKVGNYYQMPTADTDMATVRLYSGPVITHSLDGPTPATSSPPPNPGPNSAPNGPLPTSSMNSEEANDQASSAEVFSEIATSASTSEQVPTMSTGGIIATVTYYTGSAKPKTTGSVYRVGSAGATTIPAFFGSFVFSFFLALAFIL